MMISVVDWHNTYFIHMNQIYHSKMVFEFSEYVQFIDWILRDSVNTDHLPEYSISVN